MPSVADIVLDGRVPVMADGRWPVCVWEHTREQRSHGRTLRPLLVPRLYNRDPLGV